jgi:hypothetical protein
MSAAKKVNVRPLVTIDKREVERDRYEHADRFNVWVMRLTNGSHSMLPLATSMVDGELDYIADRINDEHVTRMLEQNEAGAKSAVEEITSEIVGRVAGKGGES